MAGIPQIPTFNALITDRSTPLERKPGSIDVTPPTATFSPVNGATEIASTSNITITFNEAVRNIDDTVITDSNVDSLITLKDTDANGTNIAFDATINAGIAI